MDSGAKSDTALARKLAIARDDQHSNPRSVLRALRLALARVSDDVCGLSMTVIAAAQSQQSQDDLADSLPPDRLYLLLAGPGAFLAAIAIDRACVQSIIRQQTIGAVDAEIPRDRPFTDTDAAMTAPVVDALLPRAADLCDAASDKQCLDGYQFCAHMRSSRELALALEAGQFRVFDLTVDIAGGAHQGQLTLVMPDHLGQDTDDADAASDRPRLGQSAGVLRAEMNVVISRAQLPLSVFSSLKPGDRLPLVESNLASAELWSIEGKQIAVAKLGQCRGMRAVRVNERIPDPVPTEDTDALFSEKLLRPPSATQDNLGALTQEHSGPANEQVEDLSDAVAMPLKPQTLESLPLTEDGDGELEHALTPLDTAEISELAGLQDLDIDTELDTESRN